jgi:lipopolysaccharide export system protein LptA
MLRPVARFAIALSVCLSLTTLGTADAQRRSLTLRADTQQANAKTGVVTAVGNVQLSYPARQIQATANAANYYSRERRIVLSGNVYVLQAGSSLRAETITYLIDEGRFVALPQSQKQVETTILIPEDNEPPIRN